MHKTDWMHEKKWGVFLHYLHDSFNHPNGAASMGKQTGWDECLREFDCKLFAKQLSECGAGYVMITLMQVTKFMLAPNDTYNKITGYKPGEACPEYDIVENLYQELSKYNIDLFLYFTGDGPSRDPQTSKAFGSIKYGDPNPKVSMDFVKKWAWVAEDYSRRYGNKIKGWWIDGCYYNIGYTDEMLQILADACRSGNSEAIIASNVYGCMDEGMLLKHIRKGAPCDDYTAGEMEYFEDIPYGPFIGHTRWHILSYLGVRKNKRMGERYSPEYMRDYVQAVHDMGGIVTMDIRTYRDGHIDQDYLKSMALLKEVK